MRALTLFTAWVAGRTHIDWSGRLPPGLRLSLHSRSDAHSVALADFVVQDLLDTCGLLREQAARGDIAYGINYGFGWPNGKRKTLDLVIGIPVAKLTPPGDARIHRLKSRGARVLGRRRVTSSPVCWSLAKKSPC